MKIYEVVTPEGIFVDAVKQGRYFRQWSVKNNQPLGTIWLQSECEILPSLTEEFLPFGTIVYTSHGNKGEIIASQFREKNGTLYPAIVRILKTNDWFPIWENQLVKAIK